MTFHHMVTDLTTGEIRIEPMAATTEEEARAELQALMDDCPECQAARARGETPTPSFVEIPARKPRGIDKFRRPRWRDLRRRMPPR